MRAAPPPPWNRLLVKGKFLREFSYKSLETFLSEAEYFFVGSGTE